MKLSIIVAAYNVEKYIEKCLLSCIQHIGELKYEVVVVDDGSTDQTPFILQKLQLIHSNIKVVTQVNSGLGAARNSGLDHAVGDYIWFIDGDDYLHQGILSKIIHEITTKDLDTLVMNYAVVNESYKILKQHQNIFGISDIITGGDYYETHYSKSYTWMFVFRRLIFTTNNLKFKERINMQDSEILPKIMNHTKRLFYYNGVCYYYVQQANSFTNSVNGAKRFKYFESTIAVAHSLQQFLQMTNNPKIAKGIEKKLESFHHIIYNHLLYFKYEKDWLIKIINLLQTNGFYPLKYDAKGKNAIIKTGLNNFPVLTKLVIDNIR